MLPIRPFLALVALLLVAAAPAAADTAFSDSLASQHGKIDAGGTHTCAVQAGGLVRCWGENSFGKLGIGSTEDIGDLEHPAVAPPVDLGAGRTALAVSAGNEHTCALLDNHDVRCWGLGASGRLGTGNISAIGDDEPVSGGAVVDLGPHTAKAISVGGDHACAVLEDDSLRCWGDNDHGQLGYGDTNDVLVPALAGPVALPANRKVRSVSAGGDRTCVILDDFSLRCWGSGSFGISGHGNQDDVKAADGSNAVVYLGPDHTARAISMGSNHACAILEDATVRCWGIGNDGRLGYGNEDEIGDNEVASAGGPVSLGPGRTAKAVAVGELHTCAILDDDTTRCWGEGAWGELGYGPHAAIGDNELPSDAPVLDAGPNRHVVALAPGAESGCWRLDDGNIRCAGWSYYGQAGTANVDPTYGGILTNEVRPLAQLPNLKFTGGGVDVQVWADPYGDDPIAVGAKRKVQLAVVNAGPDTVSGVQLAIEPSAGLTLTGSASWDVGTLAPGKAKLIDAEVTATQAGARQLGVQVVAAGSADVDSTPNNGVAAAEDDDAAVAVPVVPGADLSVEVDPGSGPLVRPGEREVKVTVRNDGPAPVTNAKVGVDLGDGRLLSGSTASAGSHTLNGGWAVGSLASGQEETLTLKVGAYDAGSDPIEATVTATGEPDPDTADRKASAPFSVIDGADMELLMSGQATLTRGYSTTLTLMLNNKGGGAPTDVSVDLDVPAGLDVTGVHHVSGTGTPGSYDAAQRRITVTGLPSQHASTFAVTVKATAAGTQALGAHVTSSSAPDFDSSPANGPEADEDDDATLAIEVAEPQQVPGTTGGTVPGASGGTVPGTSGGTVPGTTTMPPPAGRALAEAQINLVRGLPRVVVTLRRPAAVRITLMRRGRAGRYRTLGAVTRSGAAGRSTLRLPRKVTGRKLAKGLYRVEVEVDGVRYARTLIAR